MYYRHTLDYQYPERSDEHMITVKHICDVDLDTQYPYRDKRFRFKLLRCAYWALVNGIIFPLLRLTHGLRIYGKENIKNNKKALQNGAITVATHVFFGTTFVYCVRYAPGAA